MTLVGSAADLRALLRDPRYWHDRDPATVARVTEGFQRLLFGQVSAALPAMGEAAA